MDDKEISSETQRSILFRYLTLILFVLANHIAAAQWEVVGTEGFTADVASYQSLTINNGTPYVAFKDDDNDGKITVMKFNGSDWETIGSAGFSSGSASFPEIKFDASDVPYVSYTYPITIKKFNGTDWETVGSEGISGGFQPGLAIYSSTPYVAFIDEDAYSGKPTVMKFNGTDWEVVGTRGFTSNMISYIDLAIDGSGTPYVVFSDDGASSKTTVMKFNGSDWVVVGSAGFSSGVSYEQTIEIDGSGTPYVSYRDFSVLYKTTVMKFNGASWEVVGAEGFSYGSGSDFSLAFDSFNSPYVAYGEYSGGTTRTTVMKFNGSSWEKLGLTMADDGSDYQSLAIDGSDTPYVAFQDAGNSNKTTVMKLIPCVDPDVPTISATATTICEGDEVTLSITSGDLNSATEWVWTHGDCGSDQGYPAGTGTSIVVSPLSTRTYYVRGEGGCDFSALSCASVTITVNDVPSVWAGSNQEVCDGEMVTLSGSGADTYSWDNGVTDGVAFTPSLGTTTYTVTGTYTATGCSAADEVNITVNALPIVDAGTDQTVCDGETVTLSGSGADTYTWDNGVTNGVAFTPPVGTTTYIVTGTVTATGCQNTDEIDVTVDALPTVDAGTDQFVCDGEMVTLSGSGTDTYIWDNGVTDGVAFTPSVGTTTYTVTGTETATGCQNTDQVDVTVYALPPVNAGSDQTICDGTTITLSGSGANTYVWDNGVTNGVPFTPTLGTTIYTVTGTNTTTTCQNTDQVSITVNTNPVVNAGSDQTVCEGESVTLSGSGTDTYTWDHGVTDGVAFTPSVGTTTYTVTGMVTATGCTDTDQVDVTVNPLPGVDAGEDQTIYEGESITLTGSGADSYAWDHGVVDGVAFMPPAGSNTYTVTGTIDATGCQDTDQVDITVLSAPLSGIYTIGSSGDFPSFSSAIDSLIEVGVGDTVIFKVKSGTYSEQFTIPQLDYLSDSLAIIFEPETEGDSTVILQYASTASDNYIIRLDNADFIVIQGITFKAMDPSNSRIIELKNGSSSNKILDNIFIGSESQGPIIYSADNLDNHNQIKGNHFYYGNYAIYLAGSDSNNKESGLIIENNNFEDQFIAGIYLEYQENTRIINNMILHPEMIEEKWVGIFNQSCANGVIANNIISFLADQLSGGIVLNASSNIGSYFNSVLITGNSSDTRCFNQENGGSNNSLINNVLCNDAGGLVIYNTDITTFTSDYNDLFARGDNFIYTDTWIYDLSTWQSYYNKDVNSVSVDPKFSSTTDLHTTVPLLNGSATPISDLTCDMVGTIRDAVSPDMGAYEYVTTVYSLGEDTTVCRYTTIEIDAGLGYDTYLWNTGATTQILEVDTTGLDDAWFGVTVTYNGFEYTDSLEVTWTGPSVDLGEDTKFCQGGSVELTADDGDYTYLWSTGSVDPSIIVTNEGNYSVTITDSNGCTDMDTVTVSMSYGPEVDLGPDLEFCDGSAVFLDAGEEAASYLWSDLSTGETLIAEEGGMYSVTVTDEYGCENSDEISLRKLGLPSIDLGPDIWTCSGEQVQLDAGSGYAGYLWSNQSLDQNINVSEPGEYSVEVTDFLGCQNSDTINVNVFPANEVALTKVENEIVADYQMGMEYKWFYNGNLFSTTSSPSITPIESGDYYVEITDENGCSMTSNILSITITGIERSISKMIFEVYPNPTDGDLFIDFLQDAGKVDIYLFNTMGKIMYQKKGLLDPSSRIELDLPDISEGVYFLKIQVDGIIYNQKLLIKYSINP